MDRDKLTKAIVEYCEDFHNGTYKPTAFDISDAFKDGIDWLMQQPLSERLTEEEKEKIKAIMKYPHRHTEPIKGTMHFQVIGIQKVLTEIFGSDLFKEK